MVPLFRDLDSQLTLGLVDDFPDIVRLEHDLGKVKALQEDQDKLAERYTKIWEKGGITWPEYRTKLGMPEEPDEAGIVLVPSTLVPTWSDEMLEEPPEPELEPMDGQPSAPAPRQPATNGRTNGTARY
jgi:hypothetical protein